MNFKEAYQDDLNNAFFDEEEFASKHMIDGKECTIVLFEVTSLEAAKSTINPKETAINKISYIIHVKDTELRKKITTNALINLDGKKYFVQSVKHIDGVYVIAIGTHTV